MPREFWEGLPRWGGSFAGAFAGTLILALLAVSCGADRHEAVGVTPMTAGPPAPSASGSSATQPTWAHFGTLKSFTRANAVRFVSGGHLFGRYVGDILVNDVAAKPYGTIGPGRSLPAGAVVVMLHAEKIGDAPGPVFAMEKRVDGWEYVEMDGAGHVLRAGRISPCVDCHMHVSSQDELFGVPTSGR